VQNVDHIGSVGCYKNGVICDQWKPQESRFRAAQWVFRVSEYSALWWKHPCVEDDIWVLHESSEIRDDFQAIRLDCSQINNFNRNLS